MRDGAHTRPCRLGSLLAVLLLLVFPHRLSAQAAEPPPGQPAQIRVASDDNYPPFAYLDADGKLQGYTVDLWRLFEKHTGIRVELIPSDWTTAQRNLKEGRADAINMIFRTPLREAKYEFSSPYVELQIGIYADRSLPGIHDVASLRKLAVAVEAGDACLEKLHSLGVHDLREYRDYERIIDAAARGEVRIFCMDENPANYFLYRNDILERFPRAFVLYKDQFRHGVRKGDVRMLGVIERGMALITPDERAALKEKWLDRPYILTPWIRNTGIALGIALGILLLMTLWIWSLGRSVRSRTAQLRDEQAKLRVLFDASPDAMWVKDLDGVYQACNDRVLQLLLPHSRTLIGHTDSDLFPPEVADSIRRMDAEALRKKGQHLYVLPVDIAGEPRQLEVILVPLRKPDGEIHGLLGTARDITRRLQAEQELRLAAVAFQTQEALMVLDSNGLIQRVNHAFTVLTGYPVDAAIGQRPSMLSAQSNEREFYRRMWTQIRDEGFWAGELWISTRDGQLRLVRAEVSAVTDDTGAVRHYVCAMNDLTSEHEAHARAEHMALFDPLTDLPNRSFFNERLQYLFDDRSAHGGAVLLLDIDHFKRINDLRGHATGDRLLASIGQRLRLLFVEGELLGRFSGGTFALLLPCTGIHPDRCAEHALAHADRIRRALLEPFWLGNDAPITVSVSIGWTLLQPGQTAPEVVLKEVELAMYAAKAAGRDTIHRFEPAMLARLERQETLAQDLLNAITGDSRGLDLHLQLQVDLQANAIGAEALLRWTRPDGERVPPGVFIPLAEENGLILPLGDWVLQRACQRLAAWAAAPATRTLDLAINVSAKQFAQPGFVEDVRTALDNSGAPPGRLKLEITESTILGDLEETREKLHRLRALGIRISLDDFGTGYSSLAYLSRLPLDQLKIDKSFVDHLPDDRNDATVAQTIIGMGRGLGLQVIAEGVETEAQRDFLAANGCDAFQGYLYARPLPLSEFEALPEFRSLPG